MLKSFFFGILILVLPACGAKKPEGILSEQQMVHVMTELYLTEERVNGLGIPHDSLKKIFPKFNDKAFEKAGVADSVFSKSLDYYMTRPEKLEKIYTTLMDSLNLKAQRAAAHQNNASSN